MRYDLLGVLPTEGQWKWKKDEKTGQYLDEPVPFLDDAMAGLRYGVEGWRKKKNWLY